MTLCIVAATLIGIIWFEVYGSALKEGPASTPPVTEKLESKPASSSSDPPAKLVGEHVATILARPLFSPSRRPDTVAAVARGVTATPLARLTGVIVSPAGKNAIFAGSGEGKPIVAREGEHIGDYVIGQIEDGAVTITGPDGQRMLYPAFDPNPPPVRPVPAPIVQPIIVPGSATPVAGSLPAKRVPR